jgi:hypothetical protein
MEHYDVKRLALVLAVQSEIEGMKSENLTRESHGHAMAYDDDAFCDKAEELRVLASLADEQL